MANSASARKRARQGQRRRIHNAGRQSLLRTYIKKVLRAIESQDKPGAESAYTTAVPIIDSMANKGIIHKNKAARHKRRLNTAIRGL